MSFTSCLLLAMYEAGQTRSMDLASRLVTAVTCCCPERHLTSPLSERNELFAAYRQLPRPVNRSSSMHLGSVQPGEAAARVPLTNASLVGRLKSSTLRALTEVNRELWLLLSL